VEVAQLPLHFFARVIKQFRLTNEVGHVRQCLGRAGETGAWLQGKAVFLAVAVRVELAGVKSAEQDRFGVDAALRAVEKASVDQRRVEPRTSLSGILCRTVTLQPFAEALEELAVP